jgi:hypothetical protein
LTSTLDSGGQDYTVGDSYLIYSGNYDAYIIVDTVTSVTLTMTPLGVGTGYQVNDVLTINAGWYDRTVRVDSVDTNGAVLSCTVIDNGHGYYLGQTYGCTGGSGNDEQFTVDNITGTILTYHIDTIGSGYSTGWAELYDWSSLGGQGGTINIASIGLGSVTGITLTYGGASYLYYLGTVTTATYYSGSGCTVDITGLSDGIVTEVSLVSGGTSGYYIGYGIPTSGYGDGSLTVEIIDTDHANPPKSSILLGNYSSTGGFSDSIGIGNGVANTAANQANIGNALFLDNVYASQTPDGTPKTDSVVRAAAMYQLPDYSAFTGTPTEGMMAWDFVNHCIIVYDGSNWVDVT